jgi:hypothetical protein
MEKKPNAATQQEGDDSFDHYKAAGKVGVFCCCNDMANVPSL